LLGAEKSCRAISETIPHMSLPLLDRVNGFPGSPSEVGHAKDRYVFAVWLVAINVVLILIFALVPNVLTGKGDSLTYVATANNIVHHWKLYNPFPRGNYPIGLSVILAPANAFQSNFWRFFLMYLTQLLFVNVSAIAVYRFFRGLGCGRRSTWVALAVTLTPGLISLLIVRIFSETVFTTSIILAFIFLCRAVEREKTIYWFLASLATCFAYSVRVIGIGLVIALAVVVVTHTVFRGKKAAKILLPTLAGALVGLGPLLAQRLSIWIHEPSVLVVHYAEMMPNYIAWMRSAFTTLQGFEFLLTAACQQISMLVLLSLGSVIVLLVYSKRLFAGGWARLGADSLFVEPYLFVMIFLLFTVTHSIVHGYGYVLGEYSRDIQVRYLLPTGTLALLAGVFFVERYPKEAQVLYARRVVVMGLVVVLFGVLVTLFPIAEPKGFRLHLLDYLVRLLRLPLNPPSFLAIVFPAVFFFAWCRRKPDYVLLLVVSLVLFFGSFLTFSVQRVQTASRLERRMIRPVSDLYGHEVFRREDIGDIWLLHPGHKRGPLYEMHTRVFHKRDYHYHVATYEEFSRLPDEERRNTLVFTHRNYELDCRRVATGAVQALYHCE